MDRIAAVLDAMDGGWWGGAQRGTSVFGWDCPTRDCQSYDVIHLRCGDIFHHTIPDTQMVSGHAITQAEQCRCIAYRVTNQTQDTRIYCHASSLLRMHTPSARSSGWVLTHLGLIRGWTRHQSGSIKCPRASSLLPPKPPLSSPPVSASITFDFFTTPIPHHRNHHNGQVYRVVRRVQAACKSGRGLGWNRKIGAMCDDARYASASIKPNSGMLVRGRRDVHQRHPVEHAAAPHTVAPQHGIARSCCRGPNVRRLPSVPGAPCDLHARVRNHSAGVLGRAGWCVPVMRGWELCIEV